LGHVERVAALLKNDPSLAFSKNESDWTALHFAAAFGQTNVVGLLLKYKADPNAKNSGDWTPLRYAEENGHTQVAKMLREAGAQP